MLGAGERRLVLLDFLLTVLPGVRTGSSAMCAYTVGGVTVHPRGRSGEFTPNPCPAPLPSAPPPPYRTVTGFGRCNRCFAKGLPACPRAAAGTASARTAAVFRPSTRSTSLRSSRHRAGGGGSGWEGAQSHPEPPAVASCTGAWGAQRCQGRGVRGFCQSGGTASAKVAGSHAETQQARCHVPFCKLL